MERKKRTTKSLIISALGIALVAICTMLIKIPVPATSGYVNFGDIMIYIVAIIFGKRKGFLAGAFGSCFADILMGYIIFAPGTFIIKGLEGLLCGLLYEKLKLKINNFISVAISCCLGGLFMVLGYFIYESLIFSIEYSIVAIIPNLIQGLLSGIAATPLSIVFKNTTKNIIKENIV